MADGRGGGREPPVNNEEKAPAGEGFAAISKMELQALEERAKAKAAKQVANMFHTPDKLDKLDHMKFNVERKKASVEAMLKSALATQLDGVNTGLAQLEKARKDVSDIRQCMEEIEDTLKDLPALTEALVDVKRETLKHSQLATAKENLKHIFTVPETVRHAEALVQDGKMLEAHKSMMELENSRDDLLYELHRLSHQSPADKELLREYFEPVTRLSDQMEKSIMLTMRRILNTVRRDPKVIVTALRIIEREERIDEECLQQQKTCGFLAPGRPKKWKDKALSLLRTNVKERIEGNQLDSRADNKMWLVRHLELIRLITKEDIRIVKSLCQPVFPPSYHIMEHYILLYHEALRNRLSEIITNGLEGQEYVSMLSWVIKTYPGKEFMADPVLAVPADKIRPLLDPNVIDDLEEKYLANINANLTEWMINTMQQEFDDWLKEDDPEVDDDGKFHTSAPIFIYQMAEENLQVAETISTELVTKVLVLSIREIGQYGVIYKNWVVEYKNRYFKDRKSINRFTRYMVAIINNCERFYELAEDLKARWWRPGFHDVDASNKFEMLLKTYQDLIKECAGYLLDESFLDIDTHFADLLSPKWQNTTDAIDTVCATLEDYFEDYKYLKPKSQEYVADLAQERVAKCYITSMLQNNILKRKVTFDSVEERCNAAAKITMEAMQMKDLFKRVSGERAEFDSPFDAIAIMSEVLKGDAEMLSFDIATLTNKYPDFSQEQLVCLLMLRGDMSKSEARSTAQEYVPDTNTNSSFAVTSIFSKFQVTTSLNPFAGKDAGNLNPFSKE